MVVLCEKEAAACAKASGDLKTSFGDDAGAGQHRADQVSKVVTTLQINQNIATE